MTYDLHNAQNQIKYDNKSNEKNNKIITLFSARIERSNLNFSQILYFGIASN